MRRYFLIRVLTVLAFFAVLTGSAAAQSADFLYGKIIDKSTSEPVPFATLVLKKNQIGLYANADGDFQITKNTAFLSDTIVITCIGYNRTTLIFRDLKEKTLNKVYLTPSLFSLNEVKVVASANRLDPEAMVAKAITSLKTNYPEKPFSFVSYYRDYQKRDSTYMNLNEAIVLTQDNGFNFSSVENRYRLMDFRNNMDFPRVFIPLIYGNVSTNEADNKFVPGATLPDLGGNELFILMVHDALRNYKDFSFSFVNIFSMNFMKNHNFYEMTPVMDNNIVLYKISFSAISKMTGPTYDMSGDIFIQPKDYSIHKLEYSGFYVNPDKSKKKMFNIKIEYGHQYAIDSLMYLKYISFSNMFRAVDPLDSTCFRITKSYFDPADPEKLTIVFDFNNKINKESAKRVDRYDIYLGETKAKIKNIRTADSSVYVQLEPEKPNKNNALVNKVPATKFTAEVVRIKDIKGRILNDRKFADFYQFRELFVEDYNKTPVFRDGCYMTNKPLFRNCISKSPDTKKYWMNSPINTKTSR